LPTKHLLPEPFHTRKQGWNRSILPHSLTKHTLTRCQQLQFVICYFLIELLALEVIINKKKVKFVLEEWPVPASCRQEAECLLLCPVTRIIKICVQLQMREGLCFARSICRTLQQVYMLSGNSHYLLHLFNSMCTYTFSVPPRSLLNSFFSQQSIYLSLFFTAFLCTKYAHIFVSTPFRYLWKTETLSSVSAKHISVFLSHPHWPTRGVA